MRISRRLLLKGTLVAGAAAALPRPAQAREKLEPLPDAVGMLYDSTRCVGCGACVEECTATAPRNVSRTPRNEIRTVDVNGKTALAKRQCMHCVDPSCASACMLGALHKEGQGKRDMGGERKGTGIVIYDKDLCVGCRYCQIAWAFTIPKFEWHETFPLIVKCEMCRQRADPKKGGVLALANPACAEICPEQAVIYGKRADLLAEARRRLAAEPTKYNPEIYGDTEGGGTQVMYLAAAGVSFQQLGFPDLSAESGAQFSESVSHAPYLHGITPFALYAAAAFVIGRNKKKQDSAHSHPEGK